MQSATTLAVFRKGKHGHGLALRLLRPEADERPKRGHCAASQ